MKSSRTPSFPEQAQPAFSGRTNMVGASSETWRPQLFAATTTPLSLFLARVRRFFDIQAGSAWRDLSAVLPSLQGTVLDVGCGAQPFRSMVSPQATYSGIDTDAAKAHFGYEMPNTTYFSGDVWPVADASVNVVLCTETLEHVLETRRFLAEAARSLAPGGTLLLTVPFAARWHFIPYDYWRFNRRLLQSDDSYPTAPDAAKYVEGIRFAAPVGRHIVPALVRLSGDSRESFPARAGRRRLPWLHGICGSSGSACGCK